jgi:PP-loop superfamily ATP-utilizing enzyme
MNTKIESIKVTNQMIIDCAKERGFKIPDKPFTRWSVTYNITDNDITVSRATTAAFIGSKDLGEWWVSYPGSITQFRVTDADMKSYIRDIIINNLID